MYSNIGHFYEGSPRLVETNDGEGKRSVSRDEWINTLPSFWRSRVYYETEADIKSSIVYFMNLKTGFQKNCTRLKRFADDREPNAKLRFVSDINDEEYDILVSGMEKIREVEFPPRNTRESLQGHLEKVIDDCLKEKKLAVTICHNIAEIQRKPKTIPLKVWHLISESTRNFIIDQENNGQKDETQQLPEGFLELIELVRVQHDENITLKRDVESLCRKNMKIEMEKEHIMEEQSRQKDRSRNAESQFRSRMEVHTRNLTSQIERLQKEIEVQLQENSVLMKRNITYATRVEELQQEKESLLTRLSEVAGAKLTMDNPAITDLSDKYRPMKLSEMFSGVYDDDWTDAVEELSSEGIEEKTVVILLRDMVMTAFRLCKESHMILIEIPECKLFEKINRSDKEEGEKPQLLDVELEKEEKEELRKCANAFKRNHNQAFIKSCQKRFIHMALEMVEHAKQPETESVAEVYERPEMIATYFGNQTNEFDFAKSFYKKFPQHLETQTERPPSPKKQKTLLFTSLDIGQQDNKETENDRKTQSARADFARPSQQTDLCRETPQPNTKQNTEQDAGIKLNQPIGRTWESDRLPKVLGFVKRIVELCWWMQAVQPQVHLDCSIPTDGKFNQEHYKAYMKSGSKIDYIVWPVMFLHENGPLLSKGVAQPL